MSIFINFSNHPSCNWSERQLEAAREYGDVIDMAFPNIDPHMSMEEVKKVGDSYITKILAENPTAVMCQGEFTIAVYIIHQLMKRGIDVLSACSERETIEVVGPDSVTRRVSEFRFVQFRPYEIE